MTIELLDVKYESDKLTCTDKLTCSAVINHVFTVRDISYDGSELVYPGGLTWRADNGRHEAIVDAVKLEFERLSNKENQK